MKDLAKKLSEMFLGHTLSQYQFYRRWQGGTWYHINPRFLPMACFWSKQEIKSCGSITLETEIY